MTQPILYRAVPAETLSIEPLDAMTLIYQRRSGITHMVAEPVPEMLAAMAADAVSAETLVTRLSAQFDLGEAVNAMTVITARLDELADLGLVERVRGDA
jgi:PqqD family protein of HPr-rel-A system